MSEICFVSERGEASVSGPERASFRIWCIDVMCTALHLASDCEDRPHPLRQILPKDHYALRMRWRKWEEEVRAAITGDPDFRFQVGERSTTFLCCAWNTALAVGGDVLKLAARLDGQCELNAFVEESNREWLARIIERGRRSNILRAEMDWEKVLELLRFSVRGPIVSSYSGTSSFPYEELAIQEGVWTRPGGFRYAEEAWEALPKAEKWRLSVEALRRRNQKHNGKLELRPDDWEDYYFGQGVSAFDLMEHFESLRASQAG